MPALCRLLPQRPGLLEVLRHAHALGVGQGQCILGIAAAVLGSPAPPGQRRVDVLRPGPAFRQAKPDRVFGRAVALFGCAAQVQQRRVVAAARPRDGGIMHL